MIPENKKGVFSKIMFLSFVLIKKKETKEKIIQTSAG